MQHFYDGQIRRYLTQTIRVLSNFVVKYGDGTLVRIPVMYGDADRQVASIVRNNSENKINSVPRISVYISGLDMDKDRLGDSSYVGKMNFRERSVDDTGTYTQGQGRNYTVERLMPTPFKLTLKVDIWTANTDQKLQVLEQMLVLFNPSLEIQTTDNYIDWTSLSVLNLGTVNWSSKTVPVGTDTPIDVATLTLDTPIWISPPVKVKHLGVITSIINNIYQNAGTDAESYISGLGQPMIGDTVTLETALSRDKISITNNLILVYNSQAILLKSNEGFTPREPTLEIPQRNGAPIRWEDLFVSWPGKFVAGSSRLFLEQKNGTYVIGTVAVNSLDDTLLNIVWDTDTLVSDYLINSAGIIKEFDETGYNAGPNYRTRSPGTFDAIIDPQLKGPRGSGLPDPTSGMRYLIIEDIGDTGNIDGADSWKGDDNSDLIAKANDIIEWNGTKWVVIFNAAFAQKEDWMVWQTNIYTGVQYLWNGVMWIKSFEGEYGPGTWRIEL
jgi:hypothetical protein